jgi:hypothetical protein
MQNAMGKIGINKNMGGKNWNKKYGAKLGYDSNENKIKAKLSST